jgi:hypothetical protein
VLISATAAVLTSMLDEAGARPEAAAGVFRRFAEIPVEDALPPREDGDAILAQYGTYDFRGRPEFSVELTRQLIADAGEDPPMWQVSCAFYWDPIESVGSGHLWSSGLTLDEFFARAVALPGWAWAIAGTAPHRDFAVTLEEI